MSKKQILIKFFVFSLLLIFPILGFAQKRSLESAVIPGASSQNELLVIEAMKEIYKAEAKYYWLNGGYFAHLKTLLRERLIDKKLGAGEKYGYEFYVLALSASTNHPARFVLTAHPKVYRTNGIRSFYMTSTCLISGADKRGADADQNDPVVDQCTPTIAHEFGRYALFSMRNLVAAEYTYMSTTGNGLFGTHDQLIEAHLFTQPFGAGSNRAYYHNWVVSPLAPTTPLPASFKAWSSPMNYRETGMLSYYTDETGAIRGADHQGAMAEETDPVIDFSTPADPGVNERMAIQMMRWVYGTQRTFSNDGRSNYATFHQLRNNNLLWIPFDVDRFQGYVYTLTLMPQVDDLPPRYELTLVPEQYGVTGVRSFYTDESGRIRGGDKNGAPATVNDPQIGY